MRTSIRAASSNAAASRSSKGPVLASALAALALVSSACGEAWPTRADLPAIAAEVAAEDGVLTEGGSPELR
ncbi:MAG: hypothetical protein EPO68_15975, partial [Planctomycetota bacterium]